MYASKVYFTDTQEGMMQVPVWLAHSCVMMLNVGPSDMLAPVTCNKAVEHRSAV